MEENPVAVVVIIFKNLLKDLVNQEYFLKRHGFAMLGKLLAEVRRRELIKIFYRNLNRLFIELILFVGICYSD